MNGKVGLKNLLNVLNAKDMIGIKRMFLMSQKVPKHSSGGFTNSDIRFIKSYSKEKKDFSVVDTKGIDNYDCNKRQAPKMTFLKVDRKDYSRAKHFTKIRKELPREYADRLILMVDEINEHTDAITS